MKDDGTVTNVILDRYVIGKGGRFVSSVDGLSAEERRELLRLEISPTPSVEDDDRLAEIRKKWTQQLTLAHSVAMALIRDMPGPPADNRACGVWRFFAEIGIPAVPRSSH